MWGGVPRWHERVPPPHLHSAGICGTISNDQLLQQKALPPSLTALRSLGEPHSDAPVAFCITCPCLGCHSCGVPAMAGSRSGFSFPEEKEFFATIPGLLPVTESDPAIPFMPRNKQAPHPTEPTRIDKTFLSFPGNVRARATVRPDLSVTLNSSTEQLRHSRANRVGAQTS